MTERASSSDFFLTEPEPLSDERRRIALPSISKSDAGNPPGQNGAETVELGRLQKELAIRNEALLICEEKLKLLSNKLITVYKAHEFLQTENAKLKQEMVQLSKSSEENASKEFVVVQQKLAKVTAKADSFQERARAMEISMRDLTESMKAKDKEAKRMQKQIEQMETRLAKANEAMTKDRQAMRATEAARKERESEVRLLKSKIAMKEKEKERARRTNSSPNKASSAPAAMSTFPGMPRRPGAGGEVSIVEHKRVQKMVDQLKKENDKLSRMLEAARAKQQQRIPSEPFAREKPEQKSGRAKRQQQQQHPFSADSPQVRGRIPKKGHDSLYSPPRGGGFTPRRGDGGGFSDSEKGGRGAPSLSPAPLPRLPGELVSAEEVEEAKRTAFMFPDLVVQLRRRVADLENRLSDQSHVNKTLQHRSPLF